MNKVRIAILGTGTIANKLANAFTKTTDAMLYAVASRDKDKAKAFSEKYNIPHAYGSYLDAIKDGSVDLVYIALPHPFHYMWAKEALLQGKNVLCEKPLSVNFREAEELFRIANEKNLFFSEAMWTRFLPAVDKVKDLLKSGTLGNTIEVYATVCHDNRHVKRMTDPYLAGGMLLDCGIYLITDTFLLLGSDFSHVSTKATLSKEGVDLSSCVTLTYPSGAVATLSMAMDKNGENKITIIGDKASLNIDSVYNWHNITLTTQTSKEEIPIPIQKAGGFEYMTKAVCRAILDKKTYCDRLTPSHTLSVMRLMDSLREKWGLKYPFE